MGCRRCGDRQCSGKGNCSVAVVGIEAGVLSSRQVSQQQNRFTDSGTISSRVCKLADGNGIARRLQTLRRAGSESGSVANSVRKFHFGQCSHRQLSERHTGAASPVGGRQRSRHAELTHQSELRPLSRIESRHRLQRIPGPNTFLVASGNEGRRLRARLGALSRQWVKANRLSKTDRRLVGSTLSLTTKEI